MHHDDNFSGVEREIRFICVFVFVNFMYIDNMVRVFVISLYFSRLSHSDVISKGKKKNNKEKESDKSYIKDSTTLHSFFSFVLPTIDRGNPATQNYRLKNSIS
jgi:hypothetical protein